MSRGTYWFAPRPAGVAHGHPVLVFDTRDRLHLPLTGFAKAAATQVTASAARTYLYAILPFFTYLETDAWQQRAGRAWDSSPAQIRQAVDDYLVQRLACRVRSHRLGFRVVSRTAQTRSTVRVFLSGLKLFYRVLQEQGAYPLDNPLVDAVAAVTVATADVVAAAEQLADDDGPAPPRMPQRSGVEPPLAGPAGGRRPRLSDSYFKLEGETWTPHLVDDATLPGRVLDGGRQVPGWGLREECVTRLLFETGGRISEVTSLTLGDWVARGLLQEARAINKGSNGRRTKFLRFSSGTAKLLRRYVDGERRRRDPQGHGLADYLRLAERKQVDLQRVSLFLSARGTRLSAKTYREHAWASACRAAGIDADVHQARHWYVTMAVRQIYETAQTDADVRRRLRELIEYMQWRRGWDTIAVYEHYFDATRHAEVQDAVHARMDAALRQELSTRQRGQPGEHRAEKGVAQGARAGREAAGSPVTASAPSAADVVVTTMAAVDDLAFLHQLGGSDGRGAGNG